jgi:hypothetical protein
MNCPSEKSTIYPFFFNTFCPLVQNPTVLPNGDSGKITKLQGKIENDLGTYSLQKNWNARRKCPGPLESFPQQGIYPIPDVRMVF